MRPAPFDTETASVDPGAAVIVPLVVLFTVTVCAVATLDANSNPAVITRISLKGDT